MRSNNRVVGDDVRTGTVTSPAATAEQQAADLRQVCKEYCNLAYDS